MIDIICYNCRSDEHSFYAEENGFTIVKCNTCGLLYVTPRPDNGEIDQATKAGIHQGDQKLEVIRSFSEVKVGRYLMILQDFFKDKLTGRKATWLDIGCGHGEFLIALDRFSNGRIKAKGIEPNCAKMESGCRRGLDISFFDIESHDEKYDFISALNVYSHLPDPPATLHSWQSLLKPGGELLLETGHTAHLPPKQHPKPFELPDHLSFASEEIVGNILKKAGYKVKDSRIYYWIKPTPISVFKEIVKIVWPGKKSTLKYIWHPTDMYVRAYLIP